MSSSVDSDVSHFRLRVLLIELARMVSETPRTMEEPLLGFDRFSSRSALRSSLTVPVAVDVDVGVRKETDQSTGQCLSRNFSSRTF